MPGRELPPRPRPGPYGPRPAPTPAPHASPPLAHGSNPQQRASRLIPQLHAPQLVFGQTPYLAVAAEAEADASPLDADLADQHPAAVPHVDAVAAGGVHVAQHVAVDAVRGARVGVGEHAPVGQERLVVFPKHGKGVDGRGAARVARFAAVEQIRVGDVDGVFLGGEADAVRAAEAVGHHPDVPRRRVEAVDLLWQLGFGPEPLLIAIDGVGEPDGAIRGDHDVARGVKGPRMIVVQERDGLVRPLGFHVDQSRGFSQRALGTQDQPVAVIRAAAGHVISLRTSDLVAGEIGRGEELDFGNDDGLIMGGDGIG